MYTACKVNCERVNPVQMGNYAPIMIAFALIQFTTFSWQRNFVNDFRWLVIRTTFRFYLLSLV